MTEQGARRLAVGIWGMMLALDAGGVVLQAISRTVEVQGPFAFRGSDILMTLSIGSVGALIASRRCRNPIGWLLLAAGIVGAFGYVAAQYVVVSVHDHGGSLLGTLPLAWAQNWTWVPLAGLLGIYAVSLFPDGTALSPRWRRFLRYGAPLALAIFATALAFSPGEFQGLTPGFVNPYAFSKAASDALVSIGGVLFMATLVATIVATVKRFRRSTGVAREQMKWLVLSASGLALTLTIGLPLYLTLGNNTNAAANIIAFLILLSIVAIPISMGIAILRHGLYDIDIVINKAVVFGAIAAGITALYVAVVVGIGAAVGSRGKPNVALSVAATAAVAIAFQPLRDAARRLANRLVYGRRATPHEVLAVLGQHIADAYSLDDVLPRLAQLVTEATAASRAEVWVRVGGDLKPAAAWPHDLPTANAGFTDGEVPAIPGADRVFPVRHQGQLLGALAASAPANEPLTTTDERLLGDLASAAGLVLRNVGLIEELRASRQRLVSAQDHERRKIERNLHDGAQQHLVALSINIGLARSLLDGDPAQAKEILEQLRGDASEALENLRDLARGIYPPLLADRGLSAALASHATKAAVPTTVEAGEVRRYPMEVEAAVYFCVLEALQNVAKYAGAAKAVVRLAEEDGSLTFAVTDDGAGFDVGRIARGAGLTNMTDRIEALGGRIDVESHPGAGTTIRGRIASAPV
jgi:signal transduction histidine kinase